jgi:hypothetical protein
VTATARHRGHSVSYIASSWRYSDGAPMGSIERPCVECGEIAASFDAPDPCLGYLPGVRSACCGHGVTDAYSLPAVPGEWEQ